MNWRKVLGWPVLLLGISGLVFFVGSLFIAKNIEWGALFPISMFVMVGLSWIKGQVPDNSDKGTGN